MERFDADSAYFKIKRACVMKLKQMQPAPATTPDR
jgi:hypothetical protein